MIRAMNQGANLNYQHVNLNSICTMIPLLLIPDSALRASAYGIPYLVAGIHQMKWQYSTDPKSKIQNPKSSLD